MDQNRVMNKWVAIATFIISEIVYIITISPDVSFWDCGEFIACSFTMSVMHPPGSPLYTILGRIFTLFPFGNIAWRVNMMSVIAAGFTVMLLYLIIVRLINEYRGQPENRMARLLTFGSAFLGAMTFAFTDSHWFNSEEAEVYAMSIFFTALVVWLILYWGDRAEDAKAEKYLLLIVYLMGLATGIHMLNLLAFSFILLIVHFRNNESAKRLVWVVLIQVAVPLFLYLLFFHYDPRTKGYEDMLAFQAKAGKFLEVVGLITLLGSLYYLYVKDRRAFKLWWFIPLLMFIGYSSYLIIFIRSGLNPPIDENDPEVWSSMMDYLARKQYGENSLILTMFQRKAPFWTYQIKKMYIRYFGWQFIGKGTTIGSDGYIMETLSPRGLMMLPFVVGVVGAYYHFRRDWKHALPVLFLFIMTGVAIILYLNQDDPQPRERDYAYEGSFFAFSIWIGIGIYALLEGAQSFLVEKKEMLKPVTLGGLAVLAVILPINMFRVNYDEHDRTGNYVPYDYSYNILQTCEPNAIIFTNGDNDTFPLWYLQYVEGIRTDIRLVNLSLLNTPWYIKQLKYQDPKVPISLRDDQIEKISIIPWMKPKKFEIPVSSLVYNREKQDLQERGEWKDTYPEVTSADITVKPTVGRPKKQLLRVQDLMVLNIISTNHWKRPIYFAVTVSDVNKVGLGRYLRMDGMAFKVVPIPGEDISASRLQENLMKKFKFRNLNNPDVHYDYKTQGLLINYRSAFLRLVNYYRQKGEKELALKTLNRMEELIPEELFPLPSGQLEMSVGKMYEDVGRPEEFERRLKKVLERDPQNVQVYYWLLDYYQRHEKYQDAIDLLAQWIELHPDDKNAQRLVNDFRQKLAGADSSALKPPEKKTDENKK